MKKLGYFAVLTAVSAIALNAQQALTGSITGTVLDASEAAIPNAQVTARNVNTGLERKTTSGDMGIYNIPQLPVGEYEIAASAQGFSEVKTGAIRVGVGQAVTADLHMNVGKVAEQVTVSSQAAAIETTRSSVALCCCAAWKRRSTVVTSCC